MGRTVLHMEPGMQGGPKVRLGPANGMVTCEDCTGSKWGECCSRSPVNLHPGKTAAETGRAKRAALIGDDQRKPKETTSARIARPGSCFRASEGGR